MNRTQAGSSLPERGDRPGLAGGSLPGSASSRALRFRGKIAFSVLVFAVLGATITGRPTKRLNDFDQSFYLTIAYDLIRHGVFSNGIFDETDSTVTSPPPGMFFGPAYPALVAGVMKADPRFARAVECAVESNHRKRAGETCDIYAWPIHLLHALLLAVGVLAIAAAAELMFGRQRLFYLSGALATVALLPDAELFSYIMTESTTFALYGLAAAAMVWALRSGRGVAWLVGGLSLGLLVLTRPSFLVLAPVVVILIVLAGRLVGLGRSPVAAGTLGFCLGFALVVLPWTVRNAASVGKWGLTEEYGALSIIERFAFNRMTSREFALAFPYCVPGGAWLVEHAAGAAAMTRFDWRSPDGFFSEGRARRLALVAQHGRLDPVIGTMVREELRINWWRHLLTMLPLGWCGLWIGGAFGLVLIPLFAWAALRALRHHEGVFLFYAVPPLIMVGLHAAVANHYTRYNLILIGPATAGAAWIISWLATCLAARNTRGFGADSHTTERGHPGT